jgi:hypothetical protein
VPGFAVNVTFLASIIFFFFDYGCKYTTISRHSCGFCGNFSVAGLGGREKEGGAVRAVLPNCCAKVV